MPRSTYAVELEPPWKEGNTGAQDRISHCQGTKCLRGLEGQPLQPSSIKLVHFLQIEYLPSLLAIPLNINCADNRNIEVVQLHIFKKGVHRG